MEVLGEPVNNPFPAHQHCHETLGFALPLATTKRNIRGHSSRWETMNLSLAKDIELIMERYGRAEEAAIRAALDVELAAIYSENATVAHAVRNYMLLQPNLTDSHLHTNDALAVVRSNPENLERYYGGWAFCLYKFLISRDIEHVALIRYGVAMMCSSPEIVASAFTLARTNYRIVPTTDDWALGTLVDLGGITYIVEQDDEADELGNEEAAENGNVRHVHFFEEA